MVSNQKKRAAAAVADDVKDDDLGNKSDASSSSSSSKGSSSDEEDPDFINVDFDFRSPIPIDEIAIKRLLVQLFHTHAPDLALNELSQRIVDLADAEKGQLQRGTVVKVEGDEDGDPYAVVSGWSLKSADEASRLLNKYLLKQLPPTSPIASILSASSSSTNPYIYLHERFINLPAQIAPILYRLLTEEIVNSIGQGDQAAEPSHVVFFTRVFSKEAYSDDEDEAPTQGAGEDDDDAPRGMRGIKRRKKAAGTLKQRKGKGKRDPRSQAGEKRDWGYFRPEDEILESFAVPNSSHTFRFPPPREAEESYESPLYGRIILVEWDKVKTGAIWQEMEKQLGDGAAAAVE